MKSENYRNKPYNSHYETRGGEMGRLIERRKSERFKCKKYILHNTDPGDFFYRGKVCNYSQTGVYFESNVDLLSEDEITIMIKKNYSDLTYMLDVKIKWYKELYDSKFDVGYGASVKKWRKLGVV